MWLILFTLSVSILVGLFWGEGIDNTKNWDMNDDYGCWFGDSIDD